jgi:hypothetical protein
MVLGYAASILAVKQNNETGDRKVTNIMYSLCLAEIIIVAIITLFAIYFIYKNCDDQTCITKYLEVLVLVLLSSWMFTVYDVLIIYKYLNNESLADAAIFYSKAYVTIISFLILAPPAIIFLR